MIIVSDTTPLRYLVEIEEAHILPQLFGKVIIPEKVSEELNGPKTPQQIKDWIQSPPEWIEIRQADISLFTPKMKIEDGEREALAVALELNATAVLLDDNRAAKEAQRLNLSIVRTYAILERAAERNLLDLPTAIQKIKQTGFYPPPDEVIEAMLERDRQRKQKP